MQSSATHHLPSHQRRLRHLRTLAVRNLLPFTEISGTTQGPTANHATAQPRPVTSTTTSTLSPNTTPSTTNKKTRTHVRNISASSSLPISPSSSSLSLNNNCHNNNNSNSSINSSNYHHHYNHKSAEEKSFVDHWGTSGIDSYFTIHLHDDSEFLYKSEVVKNSLNPTWRCLDAILNNNDDDDDDDDDDDGKIFDSPSKDDFAFDEDQVSPEPHTNKINVKVGKRSKLKMASDKVIIKIWGRPSAAFTVSGFNTHDRITPRLLIEWDISLRDLNYIGDDLTKVNFATNSIVFGLESKRSQHKAFYTLSQEKSNSQPDILKTMIKVPKKNVKLTSTNEDIIRIRKLQSQLEDKRKTIREHRQRLNRNLRRQCDDGHIREREAVRIRVENLKYELERQKAKVDKEKEKKETSLITKREAKEDLAIAQNEYWNSCRGLITFVNNMNKQRELFDSTQTLLSLRRTQLICQLNRIFSIKEIVSRGHHYTICEVPLPNADDMNGADDESIAAALGFVSHLVFMLSKYLNIPLRFPIFPMSSRSSIKTNVTQGMNIFPLYAKGQVRSRFEHGVYLLNLDVEQLMNWCGISKEGLKLKETLKNLKRLISTNDSHILGNLQNDLMSEKPASSLLLSPIIRSGSSSSQYIPRKRLSHTTKRLSTKGH